MGNLGYKELIDYAHSKDMHFCLHSCGNIINILPHLIDIELDVIHPIQKYSMDWNEVINKYCDQICFYVGFDVQQIIPWGTVEDVRKEVRIMIDTFFQNNGKPLVSA